MSRGAFYVSVHRDMVTVNAICTLLREVSDGVYRVISHNCVLRGEFTYLFLNSGFMLIK